MSTDLPESDGLAADEVAAVELRRRIRDVAQRVSRLEADRRALVEVSAGLAAEDRDTQGRLLAAEGEHDDLVERIEAERKRVDELEQQIEQIEAENGLLESRCSDQTGRSSELECERAAVEDEVSAYRREFSASERTLQTLKDSLSQVDHRLGED